MNEDQPLNTQNQPQIAALAGVHGPWQNPINGTTKPNPVTAVTEYWWRNWLPILGWARWFLVTMLRWMYLKQASLKGEDNGKGESGVTQVEITGRELAGGLGMTEKELYRLLASEPIEGEKRWRQLRLPSEGGYKQYEIQQVEALRLFIPRLRYLYRVMQAGKPPQRVGFVLELLMYDLLIPEDAEKLRALIADSDFQRPQSDSPSANSSTDDALNAEFDSQALGPGFGTQGQENAPMNAEIGTNGSLSPNFVTHACLHANNKQKKEEGAPPARQPRGLSTAALRNQYPVQPDGLDPDQAFNLALDRALALLPAKLRERAGVPFYTLAAELHQAALERPSRTWPNAGGAGWVLDAVVDGIANGPVGSVNLIRAITDRWLAEGNPYAVRPEAVGEDTSPPPIEQAIAATWHAASGQEPAAEGLDSLLDLVGPGPEQTDLTDLLATIVELARRDAQITPDLVGAVVTGQKAMPPLGPDPPPASSARQAPVVAQLPPPDDPVLGQVMGWYLAEINPRITPMVTDDLRDLTRTQRVLDVWEFAFVASRNISSQVSRWRYITTVVTEPDMEAVNTWVAGGKKRIPRKKKSKRPRASDGASYGRGQASTIMRKPPADPVDAEQVARDRALLIAHRRRREEQKNAEAATDG